MTKKDKRYEKPELTELFTDLPAAVGACGAGIGDSVSCTGGSGGGVCAGGSGLEAPAT
jgi:hypothetical protein